MSGAVSNPALKISSVTKSFGPLKVLTDVSITVERGERRLILGPNGAGKTTLFNVVAGAMKPSSGSISIDGEDVSSLSSSGRSRLGLSRTFQIITLFDRDTLEQNVALALLGHLPLRWDMFAGKRALDALRSEARGVLQQIGLLNLAERRVASCSYGEKRRVEIALALASKPRILLLDEPLAGLSPEERETVKALLASIPSDTAVVMIEHDMDVALALAERITVLHYGNVIAEGTKDDVLADPRTQEVYLGS